MRGAHVRRRPFLYQRLREPGHLRIGAGSNRCACHRADSAVRSDAIAASTGPPHDALWLRVAGLRIHCLIAGAEGPAVMLLHGSAFDAAGISFGGVIPALAAHCRVFAPDLPGFGESDPMPDGWGFAEQSSFLAPLLAELGLARVT